MLSNHSSPAVVSASAAGKLPRAALIALLVAFVLPLFFSTDVWSGKSLISFGVAWNMANGSFADWLLPNVNGFPASDVGPLSFWFAALSIKVFGPLFGNVEAFHITAGLWFSVTTAAIWYSTYLLSRRDEAQPVSFAFGGEAARKDYGRLVADIAVLLTVGTYGIISAFHELTPVTCLLAFSALAFYGIVLSLQYLWRHYCRTFYRRNCLSQQSRSRPLVLFRRLGRDFPDARLHQPFQTRRADFIDSLCNSNAVADPGLCLFPRRSRRMVQELDLYQSCRAFSAAS